MTAPTPHETYMQAASKIARIRVLLDELPGKLVDAEGEMREAIRDLGSDPLGVLRTDKRVNRPRGEAQELVLGALPGTIGEIAVKTGMTPAHVTNCAKSLRDEGKIIRTGEPAKGGQGGYVYRLAELPAEVPTERAA